MLTQQKKQIFYSIIVCFAILLLVELGFRWQFYRQTKGYFTSLSIQGNTIQAGDSNLLFRNRPYYLDFNKKFQYNQVSMKVEPGQVQMPVKRADEFWVLLCGGSAMEGMGSNKDGEWLDITGQADYSWNESIGFYLQQTLESKIAPKKVRVFNAAASSYILLQSFRRYKELSQLYDFDIVVSMDGQNDPPSLGVNETSLGYMQRDWEQRPTDRFPASWLIFLSRHSAMVYELKQLFFQWKLSKKINNANGSESPRRQFWESQPLQPVKTTNHTESIDRAVQAYFQELESFHHYLDSVQQAGLFLLQPHLIFRDTTKVKGREKAVMSYFGRYNNDSIKNTFLTRQRIEWEKRYFNNAKEFILLNTADTLSEEVFVDYCHFSLSMNQFMGRFIAGKILDRLNALPK